MPEFPICYTRQAKSIFNKHSWMEIEYIHNRKQNHLFTSCCALHSVYQITFYFPLRCVTVSTDTISREPSLAVIIPQHVKLLQGSDFFTTDAETERCLYVSSVYMNKWRTVTHYKYFYVFTSPEIKMQNTWVSPRVCRKLNPCFS